MVNSRVDLRVPVCRFDFLVTVVSVVGVFGELFDDSFYFIMVLRPFRLLR